jgi:hypothetical protein
VQPRHHRHVELADGVAAVVDAVMNFFAEADFSSAISAMSAPPQNDLPLPARTTTRRPAELSISFNFRNNCSSSAELRALLFSGRLRKMPAIPSLTLNSTICQVYPLPRAKR